MFNPFGIINIVHTNITSITEKIWWAGTGKFASCFQGRSMMIDSLQKMSSYPTLLNRMLEAVIEKKSKKIGPAGISNYAVNWKRFIAFIRL
jgi:hypothetical protein